MQDNSYRYVASNNYSYSDIVIDGNSNSRNYCNNPYDNHNISYNENSLYVSTDNSGYYNGAYYEDNNMTQRDNSPYSKFLNSAEVFNSTDDILDKLEQSGKVPSKDKFRRMICNTFVCTGACPYNDRCVFLHDTRIKAKNVKVKTTRQAKQNTLIKDTFYWPDMTRSEISHILDAQGLPDANQMYTIPQTFNSTHSNFHNRSVYSLWNHFTEFCFYNNNISTEQLSGNSDWTQMPFFQNSSCTNSRHLPGHGRLPVFVSLSRPSSRLLVIDTLSLKTHPLSPIDNNNNNIITTTNNTIDDCISTPNSEGVTTIASCSPSPSLFSPDSNNNMNNKFFPSPPSLIPLLIYNNKKNNIINIDNNNNIDR